MFPLIAITAFFILGVAFFAIGKDDFGIKRVKEVSNDTSTKEEETNPEPVSKNESIEETDAVSSAPISEKESPTNVAN